jgi:hypothetical protein
MTLLQDVRVDRWVQFARLHLKPHLHSLAVFDKHAAGEILRLDAEVGRLDGLVATATHAGDAKGFWREATAAAVLGAATKEQKDVAAKSWETYRSEVADQMHLLKSSRTAVRSALRKALQRAFLSPEAVLRQLADEVEISYKEWCAKWGVAADTCTLAAELRGLATKGWMWGEGIGSSPIADPGEVRSLLAAAAK